MSTSLSEGVLYLFVLGATSNSTGLSRGDDAPGGSWGTGLSTMVLRCATGELSLMLDCESCLLRADMAFALLSRGCCNFRTVLAQWPNARYVQYFCCLRNGQATQDPPRSPWMPLIYKFELAAGKALANKEPVGHSLSARRGAARALRRPVVAQPRTITSCLEFGVTGCLKRLPRLRCMVQSSAHVGRRTNCT